MTRNDAVCKSDDDLKGDDRFGPKRKPKFAFHFIASEDGERRLLPLLLSL